MYGHDQNDAELLAALDESEYLSGRDVTVPLITSKGYFSIRRDTTYNRRGDESTVLAHMHSFPTVGVLQDLGWGAFLVQVDGRSRPGTFLLAEHWAGRCEALENLWRENQLKEKEGSGVGL